MVKKKNWELMIAMGILLVGTIVIVVLFPMLRAEKTVSQSPMTSMEPTISDDVDWPEESEVELINVDVLRLFYYEGVRYRATGDLRQELPEGYSSLGRTVTDPEKRAEPLYANFEGEVFRGEDGGFYVKDDTQKAYVGFDRDPAQDAVEYTWDNHIVFDVKAVGSIELFSSLSGRDVVINEGLTIEKILESIKGLEFERSPNQEQAPGYSCNLIFWDTMGQEILSFAVIDGERIIYDTHYYDLCGEGSIDVSFLTELVEGAE